MKTVFFTVHQNMSRLMLDMRAAGQRVIACRGGFDAEGNQGWHISFITA